MVKAERGAQSRGELMMGAHHGLQGRALHEAASHSFQGPVRTVIVTHLCNCNLDECQFVLKESL